MTRTFSVRETLDPSGQSGDTYTDTAAVGADLAIIQVENLASGNSTDVDFHLEARIDDGLEFQNWIHPYTEIGNGAGDLDPVDLEAVSDVQIRIVNRDGSNQAEVALEFETR